MDLISCMQSQLPYSHSVFTKKNTMDRIHIGGFSACRFRLDVTNESKTAYLFDVKHSIKIYPVQVYIEMNHALRTLNFLIEVKKKKECLPFEWMIKI